MKDEKPELLTLNIGCQSQDYQVGNFLNAVDELCCTMSATRDITDTEMADALDLYAKRLRSENPQVEPCG